MRKLKLFLAVAFVLAFCGIAKAENSSTAYDASYRTQQVYVSAYAYAGVSKDDVVIIDTTNGTVNTTLGAYINATTTTNSVYVFGVADEAIATGTLGRICIRGPHKVNYIDTDCTDGVDCPATGTLVGTSTTSGSAAPVSTADGTASGVLGYTLDNGRDSTDTDSIWIWINPGPHK